MASTGVIGSSKLSTLIAFLRATLELDISPDARTIPGESSSLTCDSKHENFKTQRLKPLYKAYYMNENL